MYFLDRTLKYCAFKKYITNIIFSLAINRIENNRMVKIGKCVLVSILYQVRNLIRILVVKYLTGNDCKASVIIDRKYKIV